MSTTIIQNDMQLKADDTVQNFIALVRTAGEGLLQAARMLARMAQADPEIIAKIRAEAPAISPGFLVNLLRVGEGTLHAGLLLNSNPAYSRLRMLPYTVQEQALREGAVEVVLSPETGEALRIPLVELKSDQLSQVFSATGIRTVDEQRAMLRRKQLSASKPVSREEAFPWIVKRDRVLITKPVELTRKDVMRLLEEMSA